MSVIGEAVNESAGAVGDGVNHFAIGNHRAQRRIPAAQAFCGHQNVGRNVPVIASKVLGRPPVTGHDLVGDKQYTAAAANLRYILQVIAWRNGRSQGGAAHWFEDEGSSGAACCCNRSFHLTGILLRTLTPRVAATTTKRKAH